MASETSTPTAPTRTELHDLAIAAGWTEGVTRQGRRFYRNAAGKREWMDLDVDRVSTGFWFLCQNRSVTA